MSQAVSNKILELQQEYLLTGDMQVLIALYKDLLHFALYILKYGNYYTMDYAQRGIVVSDIVTSIITRLMTKKKVVIKDHPLQYLSRAILYASKQPNSKVQFVYIDDCDDILYSSVANDPTLDEALIDCFDTDVEQYINESLEGEDEETRVVLYEAFYACIYGGKIYSKYAYKVKGIANRDKFLLLMQGFQEYLHRNQ